MDSDIKAQLERTKELKKELEESCQKDLKSKNISDKTKNLTQEVLVKVRFILDQTMYKFFEKEITPNLSSQDIEKARVYFPLVSKKEDLKSALGRAKIKDLDLSHPKIFSFLESVQPYHKDYAWLNDLSRFANEKHIRLTPQKKSEIRKTTVTSKSGGSISWTSGVKFGSGISVMGAKIDPTTQNIEPTLGVESKIEIWVSFLLGDSNINTLGFCEKSIIESEKIINDFFSLF